MKIAQEQIAVIVAEVHSIALTQLPNLAVCTFALFHPLTVPKLLETIVPHIYETVGITPHPVMLFLKTVNTEAQRLQAGLCQLAEQGGAGTGSTGPKRT